MTNPFMADRRDAIKALLAISAAGALAACKAGGETAAAPKKLSSAPNLSPSEVALVSAISQTIIPQTDTAGAIEAGVPATLQTLFSDWATDDIRQYWRAGLDDLETQFLKSGGQVFAKMSASQQANLLGKYDARAFSEEGYGEFYKNLKSTIARAYYMSEAGASEELEYDPVPGDFKGCVPLSDQPKTWAT